jgi:tetratricopeptide (TPR) repeat protein
LLAIASDSSATTIPTARVSVQNLASSYHDVGSTAEAISLLERTLNYSQRTLGPGHPDSLRTLNNLAFAYEDAGRLAEAIPYL